MTNGYYAGADLGGLDRCPTSPPFQNEPSFLATLFLTCNWKINYNSIHFLFIVVFPCSYSNNNCDLLLNAPLLIDMLSQNFYHLCPYTMW